MTEATIKDLSGLIPGDKVRFTSDFDIYPYTIIKGGTVATVVCNHLDAAIDRFLWVLPDGPRIEELKEWDGQVQIFRDVLDYDVERKQDHGIEILGDPKFERRGCNPDKGERDGHGNLGTQQPNRGLLAPWQAQRGSWLRHRQNFQRLLRDRVQRQAIGWRLGSSSC
jgi:hypothetical protein